MNYCVSCSIYIKEDEKGWNFHKAFSTSKIYLKKYNCIYTFCDKCIIETYNKSKVQIGDLKRFEGDEIVLIELVEKGVAFESLYDLVCEKHNLDNDKK